MKYHHNIFVDAVFWMESVKTNHWVLFFHRVEKIKEESVSKCANISYIKFHVEGSEVSKLHFKALKCYFFSVFKYHSHDHLICVNTT